MPVPIIEAVTPSVRVETPLHWIRDYETLTEKWARNCYSPDTEVLTGRGWVAFAECRESDVVLTYDAEKNMTLYEPIGLVVKDYIGDLLVSEHRALPFAVTPDHRMWATKAHDRDRSAYRFVPAEELCRTERNAGFRLPKWFRGSTRVSLSTPESVEFYSVQHACGTATEGRRLPLNRSLLTLVGAYVTEGHCRTPKGSGAGISITQSEDRPLYGLVLRAVEELNLPFNVVSDPRKPHVKQIQIGGGLPVNNWFAKNCGRGSKNKRLPSWFRTLDDDALTWLLHVLYLGDGSGTTSRQERYLSTSDTLLDQVHEMHVLLGRNAAKGRMNHSTWTGPCGYIEESRRDSWIVHPKHIRRESYIGPVYCPSTMAGIVCVRLGGKAMWCGNCYKSEDKITPDSAARFVRARNREGHVGIFDHLPITARFICSRACSHQLVRHRIAAYLQECVSGDTKVTRDLTIRDLYERQEAGKLLPKLTSCGGGGVLVPNTVSHVFSKGEAKTFRVRTGLGYEIRATGNHEFLTPSGSFLRLRDLKVGSQVMVNGRSSLVLCDDAELRRLYEIVSLSPQEIADRVDAPYRSVLRRLKKLGVFVKRRNDQDPGKYNRNHTAESYRRSAQARLGQTPWNRGLSEATSPSVKLQAEALRANHHDNGQGEQNSNWKGGVSQGYYDRRVQKTCCEWCGHRETLEVHHVNEDRSDNRDQNLVVLCRNCHRKAHYGWHVGKVAHPDVIVSIESAGREEVYDLEMSAPYHNYVAEGLVVHNSMRYCNYGKGDALKVIIPKPLRDSVKHGDRFDLTLYHPAEPYDVVSLFEEREGRRRGFIVPEDDPRFHWAHACLTSYRSYLRLLSGDYMTFHHPSDEDGEPDESKPQKPHKWKPEDARFCLPSGVKTEIIATMNLHQWLHVFRMRATNDHAQWEIRELTLQLKETLEHLLPNIFGETR